MGYRFVRADYTAEGWARRNRALRKVMAMVKEIGLHDINDRVNLAQGILGIGEGLESYSELETDDLEVIIEALYAHRTIEQLRLANGTLLHQAHHLVDEEAGLPLPKTEPQPASIAEHRARRAG